MNPEKKEIEKQQMDFKKRQMEFVKKLEKAGYKNIKVGDPQKTLIDKELFIIKWWIFLSSF